MDRFHARVAAANRIVAALLAGTLLIVNSGCPALLATGIYVLDGGNLSPAEFDGLKGARVVVMCKPPASNEYRYAGACAEHRHACERNARQERQEHRCRESARSR